jgi:hypothetical protein
MSSARTLLNQAHALAAAQSAKARTDRCDELENMVRDIDARVVLLEDQAGRPVSIADRLIAEARARERWTSRLVHDRRLEAFRQAAAELELTDSYAPILEFVRRLQAGEFG